ncbi:beta-lactam sensor/signal transducer [Clostridium sporogenes]|uniref:M56 family metallopeptidase n=1 Tax=Clostridium sporogenes TaxID=1509 RepID=UPI0005EE7A25|nr:M56 family metallopeptidase [Clostridium sporogenes]MBW5457671.1 beta-lactam sensor/signal transducer [Clostridium sporogenes]NFT01868.1 beta-lactam sensor/signal transducer [Clostridium sporogenes]NFT31002.1 beta-lactam sensor/signal transducer [Clostridium sporogenes]NFT37886.1 beta-lactam sensor/signal transducer [Clostridium sporogenes]NFT52308.1 beta-lactam sensor/signal transducer [Clostridium sporogenes]
MDILVKIFLWVLQASLIASISALVVILILKLFNNHIGVRFQHALLLIIILRLIIPVNIPRNINLFNILFDKYENKILNIESKNDTKAAYDFLAKGKIYLNDKTRDGKVTSGSPSENISYKQEDTAKEKIITSTLNIASCIWLIGVLSIALFFLTILWEFNTKITKLEQTPDLKIVSLLEECKKKLSINRNIPIYACDDFKTPCIFGALKPKIYIPKYKYSTNDYKYLSHIFLHELIHYKRKDLIYNFLGSIAILIHWFNPMIWFIVNRMKLQREYACDTYVLEILGKEESIEYGMTLINFSKLISSSRKVPQLAIFFETKNQIKRRIKMIKNFKKGSYRMPAAAVICCILAGGIMFTNGVTAKDMKGNTNVSAVINKENNKFLIDSPIKSYDNFKKAEKITGSKVKVPNYIPGNYAAGPYFHVIKISDNEYSLRKIFGDEKGIDFTFQASKGNMEEVLKKIAEIENKESLGPLSDTEKNQNQGKVEFSKEAMNLAGINGSNITIKRTLPNNTQRIKKFFAWKNEGMWYSIGYDWKAQTSEGSGSLMSISIDEVGKIASSIKYIDDVKNVNYSAVEEEDISTESITLEIYDKEDLKRAKELLGFNPKFPLNINKEITINGAAVSISPNSDIKNKRLEYELNTLYNVKNGYITFTQWKSSKKYEDIKKKVNPIEIDGKKVFKYEDYTETQTDKKLKVENYIWEENGSYCEASITEGNGNTDEIAKAFVNSKPID